MRHQKSRNAPPWMAISDLEHPHPTRTKTSPDKNSPSRLFVCGIPRNLAGTAFPEEKGHNYEGGRASKDVRLVSGSWPADSAIKRSYTPASREARATTP